MVIPEDPFMLLSFINMKLRDGDYSSFEDLCGDIDCDKDKVIKKLHEAGFEYVEALKQFR